MTIVVYSKDGCSYCEKAIALLRSEGKEYIEYKLGKDFERHNLKEVFPDASTYPVITIDGKWIGGYDELCERLKGKNESRTSQ